MWTDTYYNRYYLTELQNGDVPIAVTIDTLRDAIVWDIAAYGTARIFVAGASAYLNQGVAIATLLNVLRSIPDVTADTLKEAFLKPSSIQRAISLELLQESMLLYQRARYLLEEIREELEAGIVDETLTEEFYTTFLLARQLKYLGLGFAYPVLPENWDDVLAPVLSATYDGLTDIVKGWGNTELVALKDAVALVEQLENDVNDISAIGDLSNLVTEETQGYLNLAHAQEHLDSSNFDNWLRTVQAGCQTTGRLESRLQAGKAVRVLSRGVGVTPTSPGFKLGEIPFGRFEGDLGIVLKGPEIASTSTADVEWWKIEWLRDGLVGWSAEWDSEDPWEVPDAESYYLLAPAESSITIENHSLPTAVAHDSMELSGELFVRSDVVAEHSLVWGATIERDYETVQYPAIVSPRLQVQRGHSVLPLTLHFNATLTPGIYTLWITLNVDLDGSDSVSPGDVILASNRRTVTFTVSDNTIAHPTVSIITPSDGVKVDTSTIAAWGTASLGTTEVSVNGQSTTLSTGTNVAWTREVPLAKGTNVITVVARDAGGNTSDPVTIHVTRTPQLRYVGGLGTAIVGQSYVATLQASGGASPYTWGMVAGYYLPEGLVLQANGTITGIPTTPGETAVAFRMQDAQGNESVSPLLTFIVGDTEPPQVMSYSPNNTTVFEIVFFRIIFSEPMDTVSVESAFQILPHVPGTFSWEYSGKWMYYRPSTSLTPSITYTYSLSTMAKDISGNSLETPISHSFTYEEMPDIAPVPPSFQTFVGENVSIDLTEFERGAGAGEGPPTSWTLTDGSSGFTESGSNPMFSWDIDKATDTLTITGLSVGDTNAKLLATTTLGSDVFEAISEWTPIYVFPKDQVPLPRNNTLFLIPEHAYSPVSGTTQFLSFFIEYPSGAVPGPNYSYEIYVSYDGDYAYERLDSGSTTNQSVGFNWEIPLGKHTPNARLKFMVTDVFGRIGEYTSDFFQIQDGTPPTVQIQNPENGNVWRTGERYQIRWTMQGVSPIAGVEIGMGKPPSPTSLAYFSAPAPLPDSSHPVSVIERDVLGLPGTLTLTPTEGSLELEISFNLLKRTSELLIQITAKSFNSKETAKKVQVYLEDGAYITLPKPTWESTSGPGSGSQIMSLTGSSEGILFAGTLRGVYRFDPASSIWTLAGLDSYHIPAIALMGNVIYAITYTTIFRSEDGGNSWTPTDLPVSNAIHLLVFGLNLYIGDSSKGVWRSEDGGASWNPANNGLGNLQIKTLLASEGNLYVSTGTQVYRSTDNEQSWEPLTGEGLPGASELLVLGRLMLASVGNNLYRSEDWGETWERTSMKYVDSFAVAGTTIYASRDYDGVFRSEDQGHSWTPINDGLPPEITDLAQVWITSMAAVGSTLYLGTSNAMVFRAVLPFVPTTPTTYDQTVVTKEDTPVAIRLTGNSGGDPLTYSIVAAPTYGQLSAIAPESPETAHVTFTPDPDFNSFDRFTFQATNGDLESTPSVITVIVHSVNDPPSFQVIPSQTMAPNTPLVIDLNQFAADVDDEVLTFTAESSREELNVAINEGDLTIEAVSGFAGNADITVTASDSQGLTASVTFTVTVVAPLPFGDVNGDGEVTAYDASLVLQQRVGLVTLSPEQLQRGDVSGDGTLSALDASLILMKSVGILQNFPVETDTQASPALAVKGRRVLLEDVQARVGERIVVPLLMDNPEGVVAGEFSLRFDPKVLRFLGVEQGNGAGVHYLEQRSEAGKVVLSVASPEGMPDDGHWLMLQFEAMDVSWLDETQVEFVEARLNETLVDVQGGKVRFLPSKTSLLPNYPNPFNPETWIPYQLAEDAPVTLRIYDVLGRVVKTLELGTQQAGNYTSPGHAAHWDGRNQFGEYVASGVYLYTIQAGDFHKTRKMLLTK